MSEREVIHAGILIIHVENFQLGGEGIVYFSLHFRYLNSGTKNFVLPEGKNSHAHKGESKNYLFHISKI